MNIAFFMSAREIDPKYKAPSLELVRLTVEHGWGFVYGGSETGLMKEAAAVAKEGGGRIIAVSCEEFKHVCIEVCDEKIIAPDIPERIKTIIGKADVIIALPGGSGTLDEITQTIEARNLKIHDKPIIFLNIDGFWNGLIEQYHRMNRDGFLIQDVEHLLFSHENPQEIVSYIKNSNG